MFFLSIGMDSDILKDDEILDILITELGKLSERTNIKFLQIKSNIYYKAFLRQKHLHEEGLFFQIPCTFKGKERGILIPRYYTYTFAKIGAGYTYVGDNDNVLLFKLQDSHKEPSTTDIAVAASSIRVSLYIKKHIVILLQERNFDGFLYLRMSDKLIHISVDKPSKYAAFEEWRFA